jgi:2-oxoacid:acceptor oxidoreductase delta subunit (pyruvate/2-ketoisovalerate family)
MPANLEEVEEALHEGVQFEFLAAPTVVRGDERVPEEDPLEAIESSFGDFEGLAPGRRVCGLDCMRMRLGPPDASGRRRPEPIAGSTFFVPADTVLTALGEEAELEFLPDDVRRERGTLHVHPLGGTSRAAVFAGGDVLEEPHTVAFAIGSGKRAAIGIDRFLRLRAGEIPDALDLGELRLGPEGNLSMTRWREDDPVQRVNPVQQVVKPERINRAHYAPARRAADHLLPAEQRRLSFEETNLGLAFEEALGEAGRCLQCGVCTSCEVCLIFCPDVAISRRDDGRLDIDYEYCKGCGLCAAECPRGAITMTREGL